MAHFYITRREHIPRFEQTTSEFQAKHNHHWAEHCSTFIRWSFAYKDVWCLIIDYFLRHARYLSIRQRSWRDRRITTELIRNSNVCKQTEYTFMAKVWLALPDNQRKTIPVLSSSSKHDWKKLKSMHSNCTLVLMECHLKQLGKASHCFSFASIQFPKNWTRPTNLSKNENNYLSGALCDALPWKDL